MNHNGAGHSRHEVRSPVEPGDSRRSGPMTPVNGVAVGVSFPGEVRSKVDMTDVGCTLNCKLPVSRIIQVMPLEHIYRRRVQELRLLICLRLRVCSSW